MGVWRRFGVGVNSLAQLSMALQTASTKPRAFSSMAQRLAAWSRYAPMAVAAGQLVWGDVVTYQSTIARISEEERASGGSPLLPVVYDAITREGWARRALQRDPELDIAKEVAKIDTETLQLARSRLDLVAERRTFGQSGLSSASSSLLQSNADSARRALLRHRRSRRGLKLQRES